MLSIRVPTGQVGRDAPEQRASGVAAVSRISRPEARTTKGDPRLLAQQAATTFSTYQESEDKRDLCRAADLALQALACTIEQPPSSWQPFQHLPIILARWSVYHPPIEPLAIALRQWSKHQRDWHDVQERYATIQTFCYRACSFLTSVATSAETAPAIAQYSALTSALERVAQEVATNHHCRNIFTRLYRRIRGEEPPRIGAVQLESERALLKKRKEWLTAFGQLLHDVTERSSKQATGLYPAERPLASYEEILSWRALWSDLHRSYAPDGPVFRKVLWQREWLCFRDKWLPLEQHISDDNLVTPPKPQQGQRDTTAAQPSPSIDSILELAEATFQRALGMHTPPNTSTDQEHVPGLPPQFTRRMVELVLTDAPELSVARDQHIGLVASTPNARFAIHDGRTIPLNPSFSLTNGHESQGTQPQLFTFEECVGLQRVVLGVCRDSHLSNQFQNDSPHGTIILHLDGLAGDDQFTRTRIQIMAETVATFDLATAVVLSGSEDLVSRFKDIYDALPAASSAKAPVFTDTVGVPNLYRAVHIKSAGSSPDGTFGSSTRAILFDAIEADDDKALPRISLVAPKFFDAQRLSRQAHGHLIDRSL